MRLFLTVLLILSTGLPAFASTFYEEYQKGMDLQKAGQCSEAREHFLEAARLRPLPERRVKTTGLNILQHYDPYIHLAHCEARLGMMEQAKEHFAISKRAGVTPAPLLNEIERRFRGDPENPGPRRKRFRDRLELPAQSETAPEQNRLRATSNPSGARVLIDGENKGSTPLEVNLPAGSYSIRFEMKGYEAADKNIVISQGDQQMIDVTLAKIVRAIQPVNKAESKVESQKSRPPSHAAKESASRPTLPEPVPEITEPAISSPLLIGSILALILVATIAIAYRARKSAPGTLATKIVVDPGFRKAEDTPTEYIPPAPHKQQASEKQTDVLSFAKPLTEGIEKEFGPYQLKGILGRGGMGTTFYATRLRDGLHVALKIPHEHLLDNEEFVARFLREGQLGSTLHHPNIIRIYESGRERQTPYIAMELLQGGTLEKKLQESAPLAVRAALEIARDIALALDYARLKGIVHRDLKPENIMMLDRGGLQVMDYGIARIVGSPGLTSSQAYLGTPSYSSPESTSGDVDQQSDLYSLGIILYRMLTGTLPFRSVDLLHVLMMHRSQPLPDFPMELELPSHVFHLVRKLTEKEKTNRYSDAEVFLVDLNKLLNELEK